MSVSAAPYSFDRSGSIQVCVDGPEVLVYSGDGVPMWKQFLQGIGVGVHAAGSLVVTVDSDGRLVSFIGHDGTQVVDVKLGVAPVAVAGARDGRVAVVADGGVHLVSREGERYTIAHTGGTCAAFGGEGQTRLAVGDSSGRLSVYDVTTGGLVGEVDVGQPLVDVAWSNQGRWAALSPGQLAQVVPGTPGAEGEGPALALLRVIPLGGEARQVDIADDGIVCAVLAGDRVVWVIELWTDQRLGAIELHRTIGEVGFGLGAMLGIGLEDGEANRANLTVGGTWRTQPGFGRGAANWPLSAQVDHVRLRSAVVEATAGGRPVAQVVLREDAGSSNTVWYALGAFFAFCLICGGCTTAAGMFWAFWG